MLPQLEQFASEIELIKDTWNWIDLRVIATEEPELGWLCDSLRATLTAKRPKRAKPLPLTKGLLVTQEVLPMGAFVDFLTMISSGDVRMGHEVVHLRQGGSGQFQPIPGYSAMWLERPVSVSQFGLDWKTLALQTWASLTVSNERYRHLARLDAQLQDLDPPWDGLPDLRTGFLGINVNAAARMDSVRADIVAPLYARLGPRPLVRGSQCTVEVEVAETLRPQDVAAGLFGFEAGRIRHRQRLQFSAAKGNLRTTMRLNRRFDQVRCVLTYRRMSAETRDLYQDIAKAPGVRWGAFRAVVGGPEELEEALSQNTGEPLEHAIATLLHLTGLAVGHYGRNTFARGGDTADIIAFDESGSTILLLECTSRAVDPGSKIAKLATRAREIQNRVPGPAVLPVFLTRQGRAELIASAVDIATREGVAIITSDELKDLIRVATQAPSDAKAVQLLSGFVPRKPAF